MMEMYNENEMQRMGNNLHQTTALPREQKLNQLSWNRWKEKLTETRLLLETQLSKFDLN